MNIFERTKEFNADYIDPFTGYIYKIQDYNYAKKNGLSTEGIDIL